MHVREDQPPTEHFKPADFTCMYNSNFRMSWCMLQWFQTETVKDSESRAIDTW